MKIKKTKKIIRDSYNSVEDLTSKLNREINFLYKDFNSSRANVVRQGKDAARKGKAIIRDGEKTVEDVYNKTKTLYKDVEQDLKYLKGGTDAKDVGDIAPFKYNTKGVYDFNQSAKLIEKMDTYGVNRNTYKDVCKINPGTKHCAAAVTNRALETNGGKYVTKFNLRGSGWQMIDNVHKAGGKKIVDIFDLPDKPTEYNLTNIKKFITTSATKPEHTNAIRNNAEPGDIVALYYPKSGNFKRAFDETSGKALNTHVGDIVELKGKKYVRDNVDNQYRYRLLETVLNNKDKEGVLITGLVKPEKASKYYDSTAISVKPNQASPDNPTFENLFSKASVRAMASIEKNKDAIMKINKISPEDFELVRKLSQAIMLKESNYGKAEGNGEYNFRSGRSPLGKVLLPINNALAKVGLVDKESIGLGNVKLEENYTKEELKARGFDAVLASGNRDAIESPEFSGVVTADQIARNLKEIKRELRNSPGNLIYDRDLVISLTAIAHNQGTKNIKKDIQTYRETGDVQKVTQYKDFSYPKAVRTLNSYVVDAEPFLLRHRPSNSDDKAKGYDFKGWSKLENEILVANMRKLKRDSPAQPEEIEYPEKIEHEVVKGDNLTKISKKYGVSVDKLIKLNGIKNPDKIRIGEVIKLYN